MQSKVLPCSVFMYIKTEQGFVKFLKSVLKIKISQIIPLIKVGIRGIIIIIFFVRIINSGGYFM